MLLTKMSQSTVRCFQKCVLKMKVGNLVSPRDNYQNQTPKRCDPTFIFSVARMPRQDIPFRLTAQMTYHQHHQPPRSTSNNRSSPMLAQAKNVLLQQVRMKYYSNSQWHPILLEKIGLVETNRATVGFYQPCSVWVYNRKQYIVLCRGQRWGIF